MNITQGPSKKLRTVCTPCGNAKDGWLEGQKKLEDRICNELLKTARGWGVKNGQSCLGLAANQLGFDKRICVVRIRGVYTVLVNPEIVESFGEKDSEERCLSWPGRVFKVKRAPTVIVKARGKKPFKLNGIPAICVQHEIDHLDGKDI